MAGAVVVLAVAAVAALVVTGAGGRLLDGLRARVAAEAPVPASAGRLGLPGGATRNTTRVTSADPVATAAGVAQVVWPGRAAGRRPRAVLLVDARSWPGAIAAAVLVHSLRAPVLLSRGGALPPATRDALATLAPTGARPLRGAQVVRVGGAPAPPGLRAEAVEGEGPFALAAAVDRLQSRLAGGPSPRVVVASADAPAYAMPAAAWAAKAGDPVLFATRDALPTATAAALRAHGRPDIVVLGPPAAVGDAVVRQLRALGRVRRVAGPDPVRSAVAFARHRRAGFGWGVVDPGHGLVVASARRPLDAAAAAPLSATGAFGPLLLVDGPRALPPALDGYLRDIQPGYDRDPVRGVYNHAWVIGDERALSLRAQADLDDRLQIVPVEG